MNIPGRVGKGKASSSPLRNYKNIVSLQSVGSIRFAVVLLVLLIVVLSVATFYESRVGRETVNRFFYRALWFDFLLLLLGLNVLCSTLLRLPWRRKHIGFVITHAGILLLLSGAMIGRQIGLEGQVELTERGTPQHIAKALYDVIRIEWPDEGRYEEIIVDLERQMTKNDRGMRLRFPGMDSPVFLKSYYQHTIEESNSDVQASVPGSVMTSPRIVPAPTPENHDDRWPAVLVQVPISGTESNVFLRWGQSRPLQVAGRNVVISYAAGRIPLGFSVRLDAFSITRNEGTSTPGEFSSQLIINDFSDDIDQPRTITMNHPTTHRGFKLSQAAFRESMPGSGRYVSILNVLRDPGWPAKAAGCFMIIAGIAFMFYLSPSSTKTKTNVVLQEKPFYQGRNKNVVAEEPEPVEAVR